MIALRLVRLGFDSLENELSAARYEKEEAIFIDTPDKTAYAKVKAFLAAQGPIQMYLGWDQQVYPQWRIEEKRLS